MSRKWKEQNPEKVKVHHQVENAIWRGRLDRKRICERCSKECRLHAHHEDYSKPFDVIWLCPHCHKQIHKSPILVS